MDQDYNNLLTLFRIFKNRPSHLARFLIDNKALDDKFLKKIEGSGKLSNIDRSNIEDGQYFKNISEMKSYYDSLMEDFDLMKSKKSKKELREYLSNLLNKAIMEEDFEEAARIRDFIFFNKIK